MATVYIHIGIEKTGTTTLQAFLAANEARLNESGFTYLCDGVSAYSEGNLHGPLVACMLPSRPEFVSPWKYRPISEVVGALKADIGADGRNVILSCEQFSSRVMTAEPLHKLAAALGGHEVRIVAYVRRQADLAISAYTTAVRCGRRTRLGVDEILAGGWYYDFLSMLKLWASVFGQSNMIVRNYDLRVLKGQDIRTDFLDVVGIDEPNRFIYGEDRNPSLDARQVEALRLLNANLPVWDGEDLKVFHRTNRIRQSVDQALPRGEPCRRLLSQSEHRQIADRFAAINREVEARFMSPGALDDWSVLPNGGGEPPLAPIEASDLASALADVASRLVEREIEVERLVFEHGRLSREGVLKHVVRSLRRHVGHAALAALVLNSTIQLAGLSLDASLMPF